MEDGNDDRKADVEGTGQVRQGRAVHSVQFDPVGATFSIGNRVWHKWNAANRMTGR